MNQFKMTLIASTVVAALSAIAAPAFAADAAPAVSVSGTAALVSDYRFRGISQTFNKPAVQASVTLGLPMGFYAGFWGSSISGIEFPDTAGVETDWYAGYNYAVNDDLSFDAGVIYVYYPRASGYTNINTTEFHINAKYKWVTLQYNIDGSNYYGIPSSKGSDYIQLDGHYPITDSLTLDGHVGHQRIKGDGNGDFTYSDWSLGATYTLPQAWAVSLAYVDTNAKKIPYTYTSLSGQSKFVGKAAALLSVTKSF